MNDTEPDLRDIYRDESPHPAESDPIWTTEELMELGIHRRRIFYLLIGVLSLTVIIGLLVALAFNYISAPEKAVAVKPVSTFVAAYSLPEQEQWAIEYRQVADMADLEAPPGPKDLSTKWVKNAAYHIIMGEQAIRQSNAAAARVHLELARETFPDMAGLNRLLGEVYLDLQDVERAMEFLQKALKEEATVDVLNNLGAAYAAAGDSKPAELFLQNALRLQPGLAGSQKNLALLYQRSGRTNETAAAFEKYFHLNPQDTPLLISYVSSLTKAKRFRDALNFLGTVQGADALTVHLLSARAAAQDHDAELTVRALQAASELLSPRRMLEEMHKEVFKPVARTEAFEMLIYQLEMAAVSPNPSGRRFD